MLINETINCILGKFYLHLPPVEPFTPFLVREQKLALGQCMQNQSKNVDGLY